MLVVGSGQSGCQLDLSGVGAVVFAGGFRPDYGWIDVPGAFDELGFPVHADGASTAANGLYFVGVHFLRKRQSSLLCGVGEDAALVAQHSPLDLLDDYTNHRIITS